ncbi:MAG: hypothetical protein GY797_38335 [Deltaproteobacteria bacterium]|nr:hypothetical protein [Deltaproteobacteria bacterium]
MKIERNKEISKSTERASWIFGSVLLLFMILVFIFSPQELPPYKHRQLGFFCALLSGLFAFFFIGTNKIIIKHKSPAIRFIYQGGGGFSFFALVLLWWGSPYSFVGVEKKIGQIKEETAQLVTEQEREDTQALALISPNISAFEAYEYIKLSFQHDIEKYEIIEILGSYYICIEPPDRIFHRFPEWFFTFRERASKKIVQYHIFDSRVPRPLTLKNWRSNKPVPKIKETDIVYFNLINEQYEDVMHRRALEASYGEKIKGNPFLFAFFDDRNVAYNLVGATTQELLINETIDSERYKIVGRNQALGRYSDNYPEKHLKITSFNGALDLRIFNTDVKSTEYLQNLVGFDREGWKVDIQEAIKIATEKGATGLRPRQLNSPGILRLFYDTSDNLNGVYWHIPYRAEIYKIVIDAKNGKLGVLCREGEFVFEN